MTDAPLVARTFEERLAELVGSARENDVGWDEIISALELQLYAARDCEAEDRA